MWISLVRCDACQKSLTGDRSFLESPDAEEWFETCDIQGNPNIVPNPYGLYHVCNQACADRLTEIKGLRWR